DCAAGVRYYASLLGRELATGKRDRRSVVRQFARQHTVAVAGLVGCYLGLDQDDLAAQAIEKEMKLVTDACTWVFQQTACRETARFLTPGLADQGVSLDLLTELFNQARQARAVPGEGRHTVSDLFDGVRPGIGQAQGPLFRRTAYLASLKE